MEVKRVRKFFRRNEVNDEQDYDPNWLQKTIAICIKIGISKREFLEDYYPNEIPIIMEKYAELNKTTDSQEKTVSAEDF